MLLINWKRILLYSLRYWYLYLLSVIVISCFGLLWYVYQPKVYNADATLMLRSSESNSATPQGRILQMMGYNDDKTPQDEIEILRSRNLMEQVIQELDIQTTYYRKDRYYREQYPLRDLSASILAEDSEKELTVWLKVVKNGYRIKLQTGRFSKETAFVSTLDEPIRLQAATLLITPRTPLQTGAKYKIVKAPMPQVVKSLRKAMTLTRLSRNSAIIRLNMQGSCTEKAVDVLNTLIRQYNYQTAVDNSSVSQQTQTFLNARIARLEYQLDSMDNAIEQYKRDHQIADLQASATMYLENSERYSQQLGEVKAQQQMLLLLRQFLTNPENESKCIPGPLGGNEDVLRQQISEFNRLQTKRIRVAYSATDSNPVLAQLQAQTERQREDLISQVDNLVSSLQIKYDYLEQSQARYLSQLAAVPEQEKQYQEMERARTTTEGIYMELCKQRENNTLGMLPNVIPARVVDYAQPDPLPVAPRLRYVGLLCLFIGLLLPLIGIAVGKRKEILIQTNNA